MFEEKAQSYRVKDKEIYMLNLHVKGLPCQHSVKKGHNNATLFLLFFFAYAHAKRVRQVPCERVRTVPCACDHLIQCFPVEGHIFSF